MLKRVLKRDGRIDTFDGDKIYVAVIKAMKSSGEEVNEELAKSIAEKIAKEGKEEMTSDEIQNEVELSLAKKSKKAVKKYKSYRTKRDVARKAESRKSFKEIIDAKASDVTRENANMNADTPAGMMMKFASETTKSFVKDCLLSEDVKEAVENSYIHIHDMDYYPSKSLTCVQHPLNKLLENGFSAGHGESRPAKRIETASVLGCISLETAQNEMHGGQAIPAFDFYMAPFVRKTYVEEVENLSDIIGPFSDEEFESLSNYEFEDYIEKPINDNMDLLTKVRQKAVNNTVKRVHQAMEAFVHNMNSIHSRGGNQVVFSSLNYGTDTSAEGRCVIRELLKTTYQGVGNGATAIFPIQIWKKKRGVNYLPEDRNYDLYKYACKVTARRFFPNFINLDATFNQHELWRADDPKRYEYECATMGCRTRVFENRFGPKTSIGRGNISFTSINIVRLAIECMSEPDQEKRIEMFMDKLDKATEITAKQLCERYDFQKTALKKQFPLVMNGLWNGSEELNPNDELGDLINQGTLGMGFIGLAECLIALTGHHHGEDPKSQELGLKIVSFMKKKADEFSERYHHNFSVLGTPAEGLSGKFTKDDKEKFGIIPGVTDKDYYTNSSHVPVYYKCTPKHKAEIEAPYHDLERGGHIFYVEMDGDATHNPEAIMQVVDLMDKYNMGYGSVNHNRNRCMDCGYESAEDNLTECPHCHGHNIDTLQRITGYLVGATNKWNSGKKAELHDRVTHIKGRNNE